MALATVNGEEKQKRIMMVLTSGNYLVHRYPETGAYAGIVMDIIDTVARAMDRLLCTTC